MFFSVFCEKGRLDANLLQGEFSVVLRDLRTGSNIGDTQHFTLERQLIRSDRPSKEIDFDIPNFSERAFYALREVIEYNGSIEYNDGFDRTISERFCRTILPFRSSNGQYNGADQRNCGPQTDDLIRQDREADKQAQKPN